MYRKLFKSLREYKKYLILAPFFLAVEAIIDVLIPFIMGKLIDNGINVGNMTVIWELGALLFVVSIVALVCGALAGVFIARLSAGFAKNLRHDMYYAVQNYSFANIDDFSSSSIVTRSTTDVANVQDAIQMIGRIVFRFPVILLCALAMSFTINADLALVFVIITPVLALIFFLVVKNVHPIFERAFKTYDHLNNVVHENLSGIRVVKAYVREDHEKEKFDSVSKTIFKDFSKAEKIVALNSPAMQLAIYACITVFSWFGSKFIIEGQMSTGDLMSLILYSSQILMSLMGFSTVLVAIVISRASTERIIEILDKKSDLANPANPIFEVKDGSIDFAHVNFGYGHGRGNLCIRDITFSAKSGETIGILGGTGSGKSSVVQLIARLYDVAEGSVKVGGVDVRDYDIATLREKVAVVLQKNVLFSGTIKENLRWGKADATEEEMIHACKLAQADSFITSFPDGYNAHVEEGGTNLSGGQKQRICIARALLKNPKILILDDSTSAIDMKTDSLIREAFRSEIPNVTKIIIAQRIASIQDADLIIAMDNGKIDDMGTHEELLKRNQIYQEVYFSQVKGGTADAKA
ncbi:MAG: ABC transporter ATP-binding protein [Firmicutes bacterium]|nr:ABC transporter ATP-binding protein [Bacillota bacterium]